jgi:hypothetical protein
MRPPEMWSGNRDRAELCRGGALGGLKPPAF